MKKSRSIIDFIIGVVLFGVAAYIFYQLLDMVDFSTTKVIINDDENLWKFMSFIPVLVLMVNAGVALVNGLINLKTLDVMAIIINIGLIVFIKWDLYGAISVVGKYKDLMNYLFIILIITSLLLAVNILLGILKNKEVTVQKEVSENVS